jgi:NAD(P)H-hydrate epimerase
MIGASMKTIRSLPKLPKRQIHGHKGDYGRVLILGGSVGMSGAPALAGLAALRSGAGLVRIGCPASIQPIVAGLVPCATTIGLAGTAKGQLSSTKGLSEITQAMETHDVVAIGPGLGHSGCIRKIVHRVIRDADGRLTVIDADGLNALAATKQWWRHARGPIVLTPHSGEMQRLLAGAGLRIDVNDRVKAARELANATGAIVVLKGAGTVVCDGKQVYVNRTGNPGMATGGSGDVLTGVIAALLGQGLAPFDSARLGVHVHGRTGDLGAAALGQVSLTAGDLIDFLPEAFQSLKS